MKSLYSIYDRAGEGNQLHQFRTIINFFTNNLRKVQVEKEFNSLDELEIPYESLTSKLEEDLIRTEILPTLTEKKSRCYITQSEATVPGIVMFPLDNVSDMSANALVAVPEGTNRIKTHYYGTTFQINLLIHRKRLRYAIYYRNGGIKIGLPTKPEARFLHGG